MNPRIDYLKAYPLSLLKFIPIFAGSGSFAITLDSVCGDLDAGYLGSYPRFTESALFSSGSPTLSTHLGKPLKPYVCVKWSPQARAQRLIEHFAFLEKNHAQLIPLIYRHQGWSLFQHELFSIQLCHGPEREGSLALVLLSQDHEPCSRSRSISVVPTNL